MTTPELAKWVRAAPVVALVGAGWAMAWHENGSVDAGDWLGYATGAALVLATVLASGAAWRPRWAALSGAAALAALAGWQALSLTWSPAPALARDDALLTALYAVALVLPLVALGGGADRLTATAAIAGGTSILALATGIGLLVENGPADLYRDGRLSWPIDYQNAQAAVLLVGFWPAVLLAARRAAPVVLRGLAVGGAAGILAGWLLAQSKGGGIALAVSAVVVFAVSPARLRLAVPALVAAAAAGAAYAPLTAPYRAEGLGPLEDAIRGAGAAVVSVAVAAALAGIAYALADRRLDVSARAHRLAARASAAAVVVAVLAAVGAFFVAVDHPGRFAQDRWGSFKHLPEHETAASHLLSLGSNRYDFWRVALGEFEHHPLAGIGGRGFETAYLEKRRSPETPARSHSLELDLLSELGIVGLLVWVAALAPLFVLMAAGTRRRGLSATAGLGAGSYFAVHASGDWIWTFPAVGLPVFLMLGTAVAGSRRRLPARAALPAAGVAALLAVLAFAPPWLSSRLTDQAIRNRSPGDLRWARRLDRLSTEPLVAEAEIAESPGAAVPPLERAVDKEPRSAGLHYRLALAYAAAGRRDDARRELRAAQRLDPDDALIGQALERAG